MKKNAICKRADAERAAEHYAYEIMDCKRAVRAVRTQWQRQDMFACDVLGKRPDGSLVALQVTAGQSSAVAARKKKIEDEIWHKDDIVQILQLVATKNPGRGARKLWFFRVYEYKAKQKVWFFKQDAIPVPRGWFKKWSK